MHRYSTGGHGAMISDPVRTGAYARAISRSVTAGDVVLEIGTGTGLFAILAARAGARRVYAVEADDIIEVGRANAAANGFEGVIEFFHAMSTDVLLPEKVDLVISDLRGVLPFFERHIPSIVDARSRLLKPGGRLLPRSDRVLAAVVEAPDLHGGITSPWMTSPFGVELSAARDLVANSWRKADFRPEQVVTNALPWVELDYATVEDSGAKGRVRLQATRRAVGHGIGMWFETTLAGDIGFTCAPGAPEPAAVYGHAFFPWPAPVAFEAGQSVELALEARLVAGEYLWNWETRHPGGHFRQSSFLAEPMSAARMRLRAADHVPRPSEKARVDRAILEAMERGLPLGEIARRLASDFPARFARWEDALAHVGELSEKYSA